MQELQRHHKIIQAHLASLPYGMWTCGDGCQILFDRSYLPIWRRYPGQDAERSQRPPTAIVGEQWFYSDTDPHTKKLRKGNAVLKQWGLWPVQD